MCIYLFYLFCFAIRKFPSKHDLIKIEEIAATGVIGNVEGSHFLLYLTKGNKLEQCSSIIKGLLNVTFSETVSL